MVRVILRAAPADNPYIVDGDHLGHCNACGGEEVLGSPCMDCPDGEIVPYADDPDPNA